ncbi:MAG: serine hydroxymethyltransferase [Candidatus Doudnabacteria bacterium RIFCSPLOWO2_02_FULL_49_13]|uniref:Serine hydroxymethyltransferase n=1 Tax=Candidatus Doudnabacteria bacterium RIFCSPHIGHO2_12_FULL_48_16 TaxID=1817838 RepID=A0A1F5PJT8_9BACT|nr:MAG: serine hydroxymethyltransferase [Candidatus Doudnabacteria bacterium RIFCSPHIGHO2_02_FULL_49_24]OGE89488.1 MAG: serine hydroxymethyltransferase [Candidatus Doudnabacteria bacterium RIFCSPHIGHO2_01_FULL_50_67]OGE90064.1 MAG: serine hydroxymethyltransferase [Candidatus Doudnabacteria bacterium RIFCSPHIGHO2_12_FULL_48_16]OGE96488.1 MAG: serine hydroxymethyltransferase [Candidatus Doudnabacteria bacterium RIFCSPLOWO2_01_FULL_49_40]OGF02843.1 MAG: serine hydroxymethyltransferase [Candidatus 
MSLKKNDPEIYNLIQKERKRQAETLDLIASENYSSKEVMEALGSILTNKYAENYPGKRYYGGCEVVDELEEVAKERVREAFALPLDWHVNVQPYSGSPANLEVYNALLEPGDTVMSLDLASGGHLTHGSPVNFTGKTYKFVHYGLSPKTGKLDYMEILKLADKVNPKLILCGYTAYSREVDFKKFREIADKVKAIAMADISHIAGLIVGGAHQSPIPFFDVVTSTVHKTLRGPRAAIIMSKDKYASAIDKSVFPGMQGGPHENAIAAIAVTMKEAKTVAFRKYAEQVVKNCKTLARALQDFGFKIVSGGTDNHLMIVDLTNKNITGLEARKLLESAGIVTSQSPIPQDPRKPWDPSGVRLGSAALTSRGMKEKEMSKVASWMAAVIADHDVAGKVRDEIKRFTKNFPAPGL